MARFVIQNKVYDTAKMKLIGNVKKWYELKDLVHQYLYGKGVGRVYDCEMYRSDKGRYLVTHISGGEVYGEAIGEAEAKNLLMQYDYERYVKLFGELEEA